jgi:GntR family transcriptional regulator/MocR family aminotransferase
MAMKRAPDALGPVVTLDRRAARPIHRQIYDGYRAAILEGRLRPGQRLPSTRTLAADLRVSRIPVVTAFAQLVAEGYVESRVGAGTFVSGSLPNVRSPGARHDGRAPRPGSRRLPPSPLSPHDGPWLALRGPFRLSQPALDEFPAELWARTVSRQARRMSPRQMSYGDPQGLPSLREALAAHLRTFRSVACDASQIFVVSGSQQALLLAWRCLIAPGDEVWVEEPGYEGARNALLLAGAKVVPVPVRDDGLDVTEGVRRAERARGAYVTPSHQYPLGVAMSAAARVQLLEWARRRGAWIVEDDYDSEYRYEGQPLTSLHGLDRDARVVYTGTLSKVLFPALRLGYLVVPSDLVPRFRELRAATDIFPPPLPQAVLAELIEEGHFVRHVRRMRALYAERRRALVTALARELGDRATVVGEPAGMHLVVLLSPDADDAEVARRAARRGISAAPLSACYATRARRPGLVLGFGSTRPREMAEAVRTLAAVVRASTS